MSKTAFSSNSQLMVRLGKFCLATILMLGLFFGNSFQANADVSVPTGIIVHDIAVTSPMSSSLLVADAVVGETEEEVETPEAKAAAKKAKDEAKAAAKAAKKAAKLEAKKAKEAAKLEAKKLKAEKKAAEKKEAEEKEKAAPEASEAAVETESAEPAAVETAPSVEVTP